jgi:O-antigen/teichoic acid export membrane protein
MWVYQIAILSFIFHIINVPYHASIIAHERMNVYAWVSILDVVLKLGIAYIISISPIDKLILYSLLLLMTSVIMFVFYSVYSKRNFTECEFHFVLERRKFKEMFSFAGWNIIGNMAYTLRTQGSNILLNMFFGPAVNAARGVAHQVDGAVVLFVNNFQTASNPQIVKSYAQEQYKETMRLVSQCSKFSFFLMILLGLPIIFQVDYILSLWLTEVPEYTSTFVRLILLNAIIDSLSNALKTHIKATGNVKWYMIIQGGFYLLALPVIWVFLKLGYSPVSSIVVLVVFTCIGTFLRLILLKRYAKGFSISYFFKRVLIPSLFVGGMSAMLSFLYSTKFPTFIFGGLIVNTIVLLTISGCTIWLLGISKNEKTNIISLVRKLLK